LNEGADLVIMQIFGYLEQAAAWIPIRFAQGRLSLK